MDDAISYSSADSASLIGDEFVVVNGAEPRLRISNNGDVCDLVRKMSEVLNDDASQEVAGHADSADGTTKPGQCSQREVVPLLKTPLGGQKIIPNVSNEKSEAQKAVEAMTSSIRSSSSLFSLVGEENVLYSGITYLGAASVNAPRSEVEINRNLMVLNDNSTAPMPVTLSVPTNSEGIVTVLDPATGTEISSYRIHRILFCARGPADSNEKHCFAFTCSHGDTVEQSIFQCHCFRCETPEMVGKVLYSFATAFRRVPKSPSILSELTAAPVTDSDRFLFDVSLDIKEDDGRGGFSACPRDKAVFKLRTNIEKKIIIHVTQCSNKELKIERCFGLLISPGRNVKHVDMHLIDMVSMGNSTDGRSYIIAGQWDPTDPTFQILNTETSKETRVFMTIAADLVIVGIQEPVRFLIEVKAKIFPANERFWYFSKKPHHERYQLNLKPVDTTTSTGEGLQYEMISIESQSELDRRKAGMSLSLSPSRTVPPNIPTPHEEEESDNDEPLLSGSGVVSKDVTDDMLLDSWSELLTKWHQNLSQRPRQVTALVRKGIPEALRGEVWQLLAGVGDDKEMLEAYRVLISKDSPSEQVIMRDIHRTFPAHDFFRDTGGLGQDSLLKISKAYSLYDQEIGYCQGLSFIAASLLLHMPEEQAFSVLVKVMFDYHLRELFKQGFDELHLYFYQLERLMQDQLNDVYMHFLDMGLEAHMYASQWFLTLFTAKFPLFMVYHILDLILSEGLHFVFAVALALLKTSRKELLALDFEGILKYFRVSLPKKYRTEDVSQDLIATAVALKVSTKKLKKYEREYTAMKEQELQMENPLDRLERENKRLIDSTMRLEQENDNLAHELVISKISLKNELDQCEDKADVYHKDLMSTKSQLVDVEEERTRLTQEATQLKEMYRTAVEQSEQENIRNAAIIADYKKICSQLSERLEKQQTSAKEEMAKIKAQMGSCERCRPLVTSHITSSSSNPDKSKSSNEDASDSASEAAEEQIRELELELAQTKLALVESECKTQDLTHQLNAALNEVQASKSTWFKKTLSSIRDATSSATGSGASGKNGGSTSAVTSPTSANSPE